jgi:hypothetical protein
VHLPRFGVPWGDCCVEEGPMRALRRDCWVFEGRARWLNRWSLVFRIARCTAVHCRSISEPVAVRAPPMDVFRKPLSRFRRAAELWVRGLRLGTSDGRPAPARCAAMSTIFWGNPKCGLRFVRFH